MISITGPNVRIDADTLLRQSRKLKSPKLVIATQRKLISNDTDDALDDGDSLPQSPPSQQLTQPIPTPPLPQSTPPFILTPSLPQSTPFILTPSLPQSKSMPSNEDIIKVACLPNEELLEFQRVEQSFAQKPKTSVVRRKKCFENLINALNTNNKIRHSTFLTDKS